MTGSTEERKVSECTRSCGPPCRPDSIQSNFCFDLQEDLADGDPYLFIGLPALALLQLLADAAAVGGAWVPDAGGKGGGRGCGAAPLGSTGGAPVGAELAAVAEDSKPLPPASVLPSTAVRAAEGEAREGEAARGALAALAAARVTPSPAQRPNSVTADAGEAGEVTEAGGDGGLSRPAGAAAPCGRSAECAARSVRGSEGGCSVAGSVVVYDTHPNDTLSEREGPSGPLGPPPLESAALTATASLSREATPAPADDAAAVTAAAGRAEAAPPRASGRSQDGAARPPAAEGGGARGDAPEGEEGGACAACGGAGEALDPGVAAVLLEELAEHVLGGDIGFQSSANPVRLHKTLATLQASAKGVKLWAGRMRAREWGGVCGLQCI
jgi:hypothetical protein